MRKRLALLALCAAAIGSIAGCGGGTTTTVAQSRRVVRSTATHSQVRSPIEGRRASAAWQLLERGRHGASLAVGFHY